MRLLTVLAGLFTIAVLVLPARAANLNDGKVGTTPRALRAQARHSGHVVAFFTRGPHRWMVHRRHRSCATVIGTRRRPVCRIARRTLKAHRWLYALVVKRLSRIHNYGITLVASWYGPYLYGNTMACGGVLHPWSMVVAHRSWPCGMRLTVCWQGRCVGASVQDRGPFVAGRDIDLGPGVARALGFQGVGLVKVLVTA